MHNVAIKPLIIGLTSIVGVVVPTIPFAGVVLFAIVLDCLFAFDLSRRLKKKHPERVTGKFRSEYALKMLKTFIQMYSVILLVFLVEAYILTMVKWNLTNYVAAICCGVQLWSILENASSCNGYWWAKLLQKVMVDKSQRHFDIKLPLEKTENDEANS